MVLDVEISEIGFGVYFVFVCGWVLVRLFLFWPHYAACKILVPQPGIEPTPPAVEAQSLTGGPPGQSQ